MKKIIFSFFLMCAAVLSANAQVQKTYDYEGFTGIYASNAFQVTVDQSSTYSIKVTVDPDYAQYLNVKKENGILFLQFSEELPRKLRTSSSKIVSAKVSMPSLTAVSLSGSADMVCKGAFQAAMGETKIEMSGSSTLKGYVIECPEVDIEVSGSSHLECGVKSGEVDVELSGASKIVLTGTAKELDAEVSGASGLHAQDLATEEASVEVSGASKAQVAPKKELKVSASGASTCIYVPSPELRVNASRVTGASTLKPSKE